MIDFFKNYNSEFQLMTLAIISNDLVIQKFSHAEHQRTLEQLGQNAPDNDHNRKYRNYDTDQTAE